ncbi:MAG: CotH kinase family protein, partial [Bacteroidaceae bacterium]|nr:CotH kinase family protein [Bacteroidaceae bacterium]
MIFILWVAMMQMSIVCAADSGIVINEIQVANVDRFVDPSWNYGGWIELYNPGTSQINLRGYWLSDDPAQLQKVRVAQAVLLRGGSFANLWFDHHDKYCPSQIDMKLNEEGGTICLSDRQGELVARLDYPPAVCRASWARLTDGADEWGWTDNPTPASSNGKLTPCETRLPAPVTDCESCIFSGSLRVHVTVPQGATLRYTTDGSTPTLRHGATSASGTFSIRETTILRLACYQDGYLGSEVVTRSFLKQDKEFSLPIISIASAPAHLYGDQLGIFVKGVNGRPGLGQTDPCNWNMDWDRPVNFDYIDAQGNSLLNQEAEIKRSGGWGRFQMPYSFKIHAAKVYEGRNSLDYPFFEDKPYIKSKALLIRNGGNCDYNYRVRDAFLQKLVLTSGIDIDAQDYQPVAHYLNGVYKGVLNMREPNNKHFIYSNYGLDEEEIDLFVIDNDTGYVQKCGTHDALGELLELSKHAADDSVYTQIEKMMDIDEFCNYLAIEFYLGNGDWPNNNMKAWRQRSEEGRWRYILYDLDGTFTRTSPFDIFASMETHTFNTLLGEPVSNITGPIEPVTIWLGLLKNARFRRRFTDAFCLVAGSVFEPERCEKLIRQWTERVNPMQVLDDNGYGRNNSPWPGAEFIIGRLYAQSSLMYDQLRGYSRLQLDETTPMKVRLACNIPQGRILLNGQQVPTGSFDGLLFPPVTLRAEAPGGYVFD